MIDIYSEFCFLCFKKVPCANMGLRQLLQHTARDKHSEIAKTWFTKTIKHLTVRTTGTTPNNTNQRTLAGQLAMPKSHLNQVTTAEVLWALNVVQSDMPFAVCNDISKLFNSIFPGNISYDFQRDSAKMNYLLKYRIAP